MVKTVSISRTRIIRDNAKPKTACAPSAAKPKSGAATLSIRSVEAADLPWVQAWTTQLNLPAPRSPRVRSFILTEEQNRIGYLAGRASFLDCGQGREPVMWIVCAFLIPAKRRKGLLPKFGEILSRQYFQEGKVAARIAPNNVNMHRFMATGQWRKLRTTRRFVEYMLELHAPYRAAGGGA